MTEYDHSSEGRRAFTESFRTTERWVQNHQPGTFPFYSPSEAPSELDAQVDPPSDAESSHSNPPRLLLDYGNGRMQRIPHPSDHSSHRTRTGDYSAGAPSRSRSTRSTYHDPANVPSHVPSHPNSQNFPSLPKDRSTGHKSRSRRGSQHTIEAYPEPEKIRILPSKDSSRTRHSHVRSRSLPRDALAPIAVPMDPPVPIVPPRPGYHPKISAVPVPPNSLAHSGSSVSTAHQPWQRPGASHYSQHPGTGIQSGYPGTAPGVPVHHSSQAIYNHPPQIGPNGMIFSHSAPPVQQSGYVTVGPPQPAPDARSGSKSKRSKSLTTGRSDDSKTLSYPSASSLHSKGSDATVYEQTRRTKYHENARAQTPVTATANPSYYNNQSHSGSFTKSLMKKIRGFTDRLNTAPPESTSGHGRSHSRAASYYQPPSTIPVQSVVPPSRGRDSHSRRHSTAPSAQPRY